MKINLRLAAFTMTFLIMFSVLFKGNVSAEENTVIYELSEIKLTIDVPSDASVITSAVKRNDKLFYDGTFDYIEVMSKMRDDSAILYGRNIKENYEIEIISFENTQGIKNLAKLSEKKLEKLLDEYKSQSDIVSSVIYYSGSSPYFYSERTRNGADGRFFYSDYYTVVDSQDIIIRIISENDNLTDYESKLLKEMADSVQFPVKKKINLIELRKSNLITTLIVICLLYALIIFYRKHEESVNHFVLAKASKLSDKQSSDKTKQSLDKSQTETIKKDEDISTDSKNKKTIADDDLTETEDDLSAIDLEQAIAAFDESSRKR